MPIGGYISWTLNYQGDNHYSIMRQCDGKSYHTKFSPLILFGYACISWPFFFKGLILMYRELCFRLRSLSSTLFHKSITYSFEFSNLQGSNRSGNMLDTMIVLIIFNHLLSSLKREMLCTDNNFKNLSFKAAVYCPPITLLLYFHNCLLVIAYVLGYFLTRIFIGS